MKVLAIAGSLRRGSYNRLLLEEAARLADGLEIELYDRLGEIPPYNEDLEADPPEPVVDLRDRIAAADGLLFATPEYNGSVSGVLKNAVDWASRPKERSVLRNKPAAVVGASQGAFGAVWAQADLRKSLGIAGARVVEGEVAVPHAHQRFDEAGRLTDPELREQLVELLGLLGEEIAKREAVAQTA
jgi:chromate reductase